MKKEQEQELNLPPFREAYELSEQNQKVVDRHVGGCTSVTGLSIKSANAAEMGVAFPHN
jgi:hypothetical protein